MNKCYSIDCDLKLYKSLLVLSTSVLTVPFGYKKLFFNLDDVMWWCRGQDNLNLIFVSELANGSLGFCRILNLQDKF